MFEDEHPARRASLLSREYVQTHNREGWLGLYAEDAIIEDPIGKSYIDPEGNGHRGPAARGVCCGSCGVFCPRWPCCKTTCAQGDSGPFRSLVSHSATVF